MPVTGENKKEDFNAEIAENAEKRKKKKKKH